MDLHDELLRWFWRLGDLVGYFGGTSTHGILVVAINRVIAFPLSLGRLNPIQPNGLALFKLEI